jgi:hypothetical protein
MRAGAASKARFATVIAAAALVLLAGSIPVIRAGAVPQAAVTVYSGPVGVTKDDVVRVNVTNLNTTTQQAQVSVLDEKGATLGRKTMTLVAGQTDFLDVTLSGIVGRVMARTRAQCANNLFLVSTEIYDAKTLRTTLTLAPSDVETQDLTEAIGLVDGQTARLSVANVATTTQVVTLTFMDQEGTVIKTALLTAPPNQTVFLDYEGAGIIGKQILRATGGAGAGKFVVTLEVFDTSTGRTEDDVFDPCSGQQCLRET